jgi:hypothetical protein
MAIINLIKANFTGKIGQMVGAKWKDKSTVRSFTAPTNPNTPAQQEVRAGFSNLTSFFSLFSAQLASLSPLDIKSMSIRNALISLNKEYIKAPSLNPATLRVSRGGLPAPGVSGAVYSASADTITISFSLSPSPTISNKAKIVFIAVAPDSSWATVDFAEATATQKVLQNVPTLTGDIHVYAYSLDYRGSARVGSSSIYTLAT